jgi:hypothetical protein
LTGQKRVEMNKPDKLLCITSYFLLMETSNKMQKKNLTLLDETRTFEKRKIEYAKVGNMSIGRAIRT